MRRWSSLRRRKHLPQNWIKKAARLADALKPRLRSERSLRGRLSAPVGEVAALLFFREVTTVHAPPSPAVWPKEEGAPEGEGKDTTDLSRPSCNRGEPRRSGGPEPSPAHNCPPHCRKRGVEAGSQAEAIDAAEIREGHLDGPRVTAAQRADGEQSRAGGSGREQLAKERAMRRSGWPPRPEWPAVGAGAGAWLPQLVPPPIFVLIQDLISRSYYSLLHKMSISKVSLTSAAVDSAGAAPLVQMVAVARCRGGRLRL